MRARLGRDGGWSAGLAPATGGGGDAATAAVKGLQTTGQGGGRDGDGEAAIVGGALEEKQEGKVMATKGRRGWRGGRRERPR
ncbi:hypothetical protein NL676_006724 [Syzygium grande]|nr:hypothetical protein NL676_006724 [Syzygium grande]